MGLQKDANIRCAVFFSGSILFQIITSITTESSTSQSKYAASSGAALQ